MRSTRRFLAPAKVNLALRVVGRRADGYHLLQSVMVFFPLYDQLEITLLPEGLELLCEPAVTASPEENLVWRAAFSLLKESGLARGARLRLIKRIPDGAGLGGGSSDAALTLLALNRMWGVHLGLERLLELGVALGADVPFFLGGRSALVAGIGERLTPLSALPSAELVLVHPGISLSTRRVFAHLDGRFPDHPQPMILPDAEGDLAGVLENDLELSARALAPVIDDLFRALERLGSIGSLMSGSGSCVFGLFPDAVTAREAAGRLAQEHAGWRVYQGRIFHEHPFEREWASG